MTGFFLLKVSRFSHAIGYSNAFSLLNRVLLYGIIPLESVIAHLASFHLGLSATLL